MHALMEIEASMNSKLSDIGRNDLSVSDEELRKFLEDGTVCSPTDTAPPLSYSDYSSSKGSFTGSFSTPSTSRNGSPSTKWSHTPYLSAKYPSLPDFKLTPAAMHHREDTASSVASSTPSTDLDEDEVRPPNNFAEVGPGLYRSSFPKRQHFAFLRSLGLKTLLNFTQDEYPQENLEFLEEEGITFMQIGMPGNKEETIHVPPSSIEEAIRVILNPNNYPLLIHCNKGRHRTGCVVGVLRKLQNWPMEAILEEYRQFSFPKSRAIDQTCIATFDVAAVWESVRNTARPVWVPTYESSNSITTIKAISGTVEAEEQHLKA